MHKWLFCSLFFTHSLSELYYNELFFHRKKRIRKSFKQPASLKVPLPFLCNAKNFMKNFLQHKIQPAKRTNIGLQKAFSDIFPIISNGATRLDFISYGINNPLFDVHERLLRGVFMLENCMLKIRLTVFDRELISKLSCIVLKKKFIWVKFPS